MKELFKSNKKLCIASIIIFIINIFLIGYAFTFNTYNRYYTFDEGKYCLSNQEFVIDLNKGYKDSIYEIQSDASMLGSYVGPYNKLKSVYNVIAGYAGADGITKDMCDYLIENEYVSYKTYEDFIDTDFEYRIEYSNFCVLHLTIRAIYECNSGSSSEREIYNNMMLLGSYSYNQFKAYYSTTKSYYLNDEQISLNQISSDCRYFGSIASISRSFYNKNYRKVIDKNIDNIQLSNFDRYVPCYKEQYNDSSMSGYIKYLSTLYLNSAEDQAYEYISRTYQADILKYMEVTLNGWKLDVVGVYEDSEDSVIISDELLERNKFRGGYGIYDKSEFNEISSGSITHFIGNNYNKYYEDTIHFAHVTGKDNHPFIAAFISMLLFLLECFIIRKILSTIKISSHQQSRSCDMR